MNKLNVLLLGSGGREHALAWSVGKSPLLQELFIAPGNAGTRDFGKNIELDILDNDSVIDFCITQHIDVVIVGPEAPLVNGIHDAIEADERLTKTTVIGPKKAGAMLEGSKDYSKQFMLKHDIPTAAYKTFGPENVQEGLTFLETLSPPYVLKCDGLAAGKGVLIIDDIDEAKTELQEILVGGAFGSAGQKVVIEEFLDGTELSAFILTDGKDYLLLPTAKDYKRIGEGDTGLNTGGMGALSPAPAADEEFMAKVKEKIIDRSIHGLQKEGIDYVGFLFIGLMRVGDEPFVIEYNVRMGDPETEAVLPRIQSDLLAHFHAIGHGQLKDEKMDISTKHSCTVMMVSGGYPKSYEKGKVIKGLDQVSADSFAFHAGTAVREGQIVTNGGRVLTVTTVDESLTGALEKSYSNLEKISFDNSFYRKDIGYELAEQ
jgi:phosphoribosylamine--glycine ligase